MNMKEVRKMAGQYGLKIGSATKAEAIRQIQHAEGNFDCFGRAETGYCDQDGCIFRQDCLKPGNAEPAMPL